MAELAIAAQAKNSDALSKLLKTRDFVPARP